MTEAEVQRLMGLAREATQEEILAGLAMGTKGYRPERFNVAGKWARLESALRELLPATAAPAAQQPDPHADIVAWANQSADPSWPWPTVTRYSGGASTEGLHGRVWLRLQDGGPDLEYVPATTAPAAPEAPSLRAAAEKALHEMCNTSAPRESFTDAVDVLAAALSAEAPADARDAARHFELTDAMFDVIRKHGQPSGVIPEFVTYRGDFGNWAYLFGEIMGAAMAAPTPDHSGGASEMVQPTPQEPAREPKRCRCGFPAPCTRTVPVGFCGATTQEQKP